MAELDIGNHCSVITCGQLDFLPFFCDYCKQVFCKVHKETTSHQCVAENLVIEKKVSEKIIYRCSFENCKITSLVSIKCSICFKQFCLTHRSAESHNCSKLQKPAKDAFPLTKPTFFVPKKIKFKNKRSEKLAAKVALMKLKMCANGKSNISSDDRIYFLIYHLDKDLKYSVFVSKYWTVGKCLDEIASEAKVSNNNNIPGKTVICLLSVTTGEVLENDKIINDLLNEEVIYNGSTIMLTNKEQ